MSHLDSLLSVKSREIPESPLGFSDKKDLDFEDQGDKKSIEDLKQSIQFKTYGCKVNSYDTGWLEKKIHSLSRGELLKKENEEGSQTLSSSPSLYILNTCAVTAEATLEAIREVRRIKAKDPHSFVVVTGCAAQVDTDQFEHLQAVDLIVANSHKGEIDSIIEKKIKGELHQKTFKSNIFKKEDLEDEGGRNSSHKRSFLKIQDGCNSFCTYCVIPFARGKSRSLTVDSIVNKVNQLDSEGVKEIVLTGVHIGDYSDDSYLNGSMGLEDLVEQLLLRTSVGRFRLSSLEPPEITDRLLSLYKNPRLCPHFHMSIQSAESQTLKKMKRVYDAFFVEKSLKQIQQRVPEAFVGMDVIVGFPGETHEQFEETFLRLESLPWTRLHVFPYSERPGTFAQKILPKVPAREIQLRAHRLRELSQRRLIERAQSQIGTIKKGLLIQNKKKLLFLTRDYWNVELNKENYGLDLDFLSQNEVDLQITDFQFKTGTLHQVLSGKRS